MNLRPICLDLFPHLGRVFWSGVGCPGAAARLPYGRADVFERQRVRHFERPDAPRPRCLKTL